MNQAADAISAYTQVKLEDAPKLVKNSQIRMSGCLFHDKWPKSWWKIEDPVVLLEQNLYGHP